MNTKADSSSNEDVLSSGISSMSDDAPSIENGTYNGHKQYGTKEDIERWRNDHEMEIAVSKRSVLELSGRLHDHSLTNGSSSAANSEVWRSQDMDQKRWLVNGHKQQNLNYAPTDLNPSPQAKPISGIMSGNFATGAQIYTPFGDAGKAYFLDSDLETIEEESSVLDSDFDDRSSLGCDRMQKMGDVLLPHNQHSRSHSASNSNLFLFQRDSVTSTITASDGEKSPSTLSSVSPNRSSSPSGSERSTPNNEQPDKRGWDEISHRTHGQNISEIGAIDPNLHQKIVYAKCLSPGEERRQVHSVSASRPVEYKLPVANKHLETAQNGYTRRKKHGYKKQKTELTISDMFEAVRIGDLKTLNKFSSTEQSETVDEGGNTILHAAANTGQLQCVEYLARGSCKLAVSLLNDDLMTPTALSVQNGHLSCVKWLVKNTTAKEELIVSSKQASIDGSSMRPPLAHVAARCNQDEVLDWLCEQMAEEKFPIDSADHYSNAAVHEAAARGHLKCLQTLVGRGASVSILNSHGQTPGQVADKNGHTLCVGYLVVVETCMSLAQQLITVKSENEGIRKENNALRKQVREMHNEKLAQAKESVEERIRATLQSLSSYEEDNESNLSVLHHQPNNATPPKTDAVDDVARSCTVLPTGPSKPTPSESVENGTVHKPEQTTVKSASKILKLAAHSTTLPGTISKHLPVAKQSTDGFDLKSTNVANVRDHDRSKEVNMEEEIHAEVQNLTDGLKLPRGEQENASNLTAKTSPAQPQTVKAWEKMAMDEVLRLARDSRYLPSPTMSMCTEDSTMETREVMRDRLAEASRWFLVQQSGGKPRIKDPMLPTHRSRPLAMSVRPVGNTASWVLGDQRSKPPMRTVANPPPLTTIPQSLVAATNKHYQSLQEQQGTGKSQAKDTSTAQRFVSPSITSPLSSFTERLDNVGSARPRSAKSTSSNTSVSMVRQKDSSPSTISNSAAYSHNAVADNNLYRETYLGAITYPGSDPLQKKQLPAGSGSPSSIHSRDSSRPTSAKRPLTSSDIPSDMLSGLLSPGSDAAAVRVALPSRNNSFLRKVQNSTETLSTDAAVCYPSTPSKFSPKPSTNLPSNSKFQSLVHSGSSSAAFSPVSRQDESTVVARQNEITSIPARKETVINGSSYTMWRPSSKGATKFLQTTAVADASSKDSIPEKTKKSKIPTKYSYGGLFSSNSPKSSSKKKATKLFHL